MDVLAATILIYVGVSVPLMLLGEKKYQLLAIILLIPTLLVFAHVIELQEKENDTSSKADHCTCAGSRTALERVSEGFKDEGQQGNADAQDNIGEKFKVRP
ncbi:MAG: hypothetical protein LBR94_05675 [Desulfovibrio sp.]|jgi:hypothetical protein|nr:hypothetical protein [Desulfovibrio sp.]